MAASAFGQPSTSSTPKIHVRIVCGPTLGHVTEGKTLTTFCTDGRLGASLPLAVIPGYTDVMKTAISVPDDTFDRASRRARELGMSRSEFFATAAQRYLETLDHDSLTARIDQALALVGDDPDTAAAVGAGRRRLAQGDW